MRVQTVNGRAAARGWRLAGAPISWGVCEVPGWGRMLPADRVLSEMASLGLRASELGAPGFLPEDPAAIRAALARHGLTLVAGFVPLVLREHTLDYAALHRIAGMLARAGAELLVAAAVTDTDWSAPEPLDDRSWDRLVANLDTAEQLAREHGLTLAVHPHAGTLVETAADVERLLATSGVPWCLDTGHLLLGGADPAAFTASHAQRIVHVHLKDVDARLAARVRARELTFQEATRRGLFRPLGRGDCPIEEVVRLLDEHGYERWLVVEQDTAITGEEPPVGRGPVLDVRKSVEYLANLAPTRRRVSER